MEDVDLTMRYIGIGFAIVATVFIGSCSKAPAPAPAPVTEKKPNEPSPSTTTVPADPVVAAAHPEKHHHVAPHDGTLILIGEHAGHLEFVLDANSGKLTMYALDGEAEDSVRLNSLGIDMHIAVPDSPEFDVELKPVENVLTGETGTSTSQYAVQSDALKGVNRFTATIPELAFRGLELENVQVSFPSGNE